MTSPKSRICAVCNGPLRDGLHGMSEADRRALPFAHCPKCGGGPKDGHPSCATAKQLFYKCSCGVTWTVAR